MQNPTKIKKSVYNVIVPQKANRICVFNLWSGAVVEFDEYESKNFNNKKWDLFSKEEITSLLKMKILTTSTNEFEEVLKENANYNAKDPNCYSICIAPTTKCNARCAYCFEIGAIKKKMSPDTALQLVNYIINQAKGRKVFIRWFGGEPLLAMDTMLFICKELKKNSIEYASSMVSNGSLIDTYRNEMFHELNLKNIQITLDDLYEKYDAVKNYANNDCDFQKIIDNIHKIAETGINVDIRINFSCKNLKTAYKVLNWTKSEFFAYKNVNPYCHHIMGDNFLLPTEISPNPYVTIFDTISKQRAIKHLREFMISRRYIYCSCWSEEYVNVDPEGFLYKCEHYIGQEKYAVGNIYEISKEKLFYDKSKQLLDECKKCKCFPICGGGCFAENQRKETAGCVPIVNAIDDIISLWLKIQHNEKEVD